VLAGVGGVLYGRSMFGMGIPELMVVLVIVLIFFGAGKLPEVMGSLGKGIQQFKRGLKEPPEIDVTPEQPSDTTKRDAGVH
jgi:sec-independent protein translocase protein TatA